MFLKQSTAVTVKMGPFLDSVDGNTQETLLTISQADIRLTKNGGAYAQTNNVAGATHDEKGNYGVPLDTTDTNTLGTLRVHIHETGALAVWQDFMVVTANVWDSLFGADAIQVDLTQIVGVAQSATDLKDFADDGYDPATNKVQGVVLVDPTTTVTGGATAAALATVQADTDDIQARLPAALTIDGLMKADTLRVGGTLQTAGDIYALLVLVAGYIDTEVAAIKAKTDQLTFTIANKLDSSIQAAGDFAQGAADKVWLSASRTLTAFGFTVAANVTTWLGAAVAALTANGYGQAMLLR